MSDASNPTQTSMSHNIAGRIMELKVSGNLMTLDVGLFCLFQQPGLAVAPLDGSGLPGVRISLPPRVHGVGAAGAVQTGGQGTITIRGLHEDGWLGQQDGAALVRVTGAPAQILITVYQSPDHPADTAPRLQVVPLAGTAPVPAQGTGPANPRSVAAAPASAKAGDAGAAAGKDIVAHIHRTGDVGAALGEWMGTPGSGNWIEGFGIAPQSGIAAADIEYQAVLGRGWLSPWITGGKFCGSRGMALPMLGFNLRLRGKAAERFDCEYRASFVDGTRIGPLPAGTSCEAPSLSPLEAFQVTLRPRAAGMQPAAAKPAARVPAKPVAKVAAKPAAKVMAKPAAKKPAVKPVPAKKPATAGTRKRGR